jgi:outer membrane protein assembly factor BamB
MRIVIGWLLLFSVASAAPRILIEADSLRFGSISAGGSHTRSVDIKNIGDGALVIREIEPGNQVITFLSPTLPDTLFADDIHSFTFEFSPTNEISYNTVINFSNNDPLAPSAHLPVLARGIRAFEPGEVIWSYQGIENVVCVTSMDDVNNDGIEDVVAESFDSGANGNNLLCISGSGLGTGNLVWSARPLGGPSNSGGYGDQCLITIDDLNRNSTPDIILGTAWGSRTVFGIEGTTGQTIWSYDTYQNAPSGWIYSVASMGDINGDSIPEVLAGAGSDANRGYCLDGATGAKRWRYITGEAVFSVCRLDDVTGDSISDAILATGDYGDGLYCVSGAATDSSRVIWITHTGGGAVQSIDRIPDINNDGYNDIIAGTWYSGHRVMAISGHSDTTFSSVIWSVAIGNPVMKVVVCPDLNGDGFEDVLVASWGNYAIALSGRNGAELWRYTTGDDVWAIHWSYDVTGDSLADVIAGSFTGSTFLLSGDSGNVVWESPGNSKIFTVRPIHDVNGDGFPDVIAGQQMLNNVGGKVMLISGGGDGTAIGDDIHNRLPDNSLLIANYPNPFNNSTVIEYSLPEASDVSLIIYNLMGQKIATLVNLRQSAGNYKVIWDGIGSDGNIVSSGIYFARLTSDSRAALNKMTVLR